MPLSGKLRGRLLVVVVVMALAAWIGYLRSDRHRLNHQLDQLEELMSKDSSEGELVAWANARKVAGFFAPGFVVLARPYEGQLTDPQQLMAGVHRYRTAAGKIHLSIHDRELTLHSANDTASVNFVATVRMDFGDRKGRESYRVSSQWRKDDGAWRISQLELLERLDEGDGLNLF